MANGSRVSRRARGLSPHASPSNFLTNLPPMQFHVLSVCHGCGIGLRPIPAVCLSVPGPFRAHSPFPSFPRFAFPEIPSQSVFFFLRFSPRRKCARIHRTFWVICSSVDDVVLLNSGGAGGGEDGRFAQQKSMEGKKPLG
ncbi:hypothetical protein niasHT_007660 [Heterodera trifolii]|uniref:Uncharacterized protein n=1 Tax=Heterodera trifolii TaxID=157864 RepID=A0ABD2LPU2_9BILA